VKQTFQHLWTLQQLDNELRTLEEKLVQVPVRMQDLRRAAATVKAELDQAKVAIIKHKKQYKLSEVELGAAEGKIQEYSVKLYKEGSKSNEQYKALLKEIEYQQKLKRDTEEQMITLLEETEALDRRVRENEGESVELDAETERKILLLEAERKELEVAIAERRAQRQATAAEIPVEMLKRYERISSSKGGKAIATVRKERCSGCLSPIPAQRIIEVERQDRLYLCEACGRMLIFAQE